jgi:hypothetical protein
MIKLHEDKEDPECKQSFEREVIIEDDRFRVQAYCMEGENKIQIYDSEEIELKKKIIPEKSSFEWRGDGKVLITMRKENAPSFWKYLLKDPKKEVKELQIWWEMRDKYIE